MKVRQAETVEGNRQEETVEGKHCLTCSRVQREEVKIGQLSKHTRKDPSRGRGVRRGVGVPVQLAQHGR